MKTSPPSFRALTCFLLMLSAGMLSGGCSKNDRTSSMSTTSTTAAGTVNAAGTWESIKDFSYQQRSEFASQTNDVASRLERDSAIAKGNAASRLAEARDELRTAATEIGNASADTWEATKERVGRALQKAESAYQNAAE